MELYLERGFELTTVAEIAGRAGLTARTFFRYFADKREVLFAGSASLQEALVVALEGAPDAASPMEAVAAALDAAAALLGEGREYSRQRQSVITANAELRERELIKMASLSAALAEGLRRRASPTLTRAWPPRRASSSFAWRSSVGSPTRGSETCWRPCASHSTN